MHDVRARGMSLAFILTLHHVSGTMGARKRFSSFLTFSVKIVEVDFELKRSL